KRLTDAMKQQQGAAGDAARDLERQRLAERMQKSADEMRGAAAEAADGDKKSSGDPGSSKAADRSRQADAQQDMARTLDKAADRLASAGGLKDADARKAAEQLARAQQLRDRMAAASREMEKLGRQNGQPGSQTSPQRTPGESGRSGEGRSGGGAP